MNPSPFSGNIYHILGKVKFSGNWGILFFFFSVSLSLLNFSINCEAPPSSGGLAGKAGSRGSRYEPSLKRAQMCLFWKRFQLVLLFGLLTLFS